MVLSLKLTAEQTERDDVKTVAEGRDDDDGRPLPTDVDDASVMFLKFVPRMKQPVSQTPIIDLKGPPTLQQLTDAGLNPGGWTKDSVVDDYLSRNNTCTQRHLPTLEK